MARITCRISLTDHARVSHSQRVNESTEQKNLLRLACSISNAACRITAACPLRRTMLRASRFPLKHPRSLCIREDDTVHEDDVGAKSPTRRGGLFPIRFLQRIESSRLRASDVQKRPPTMQQWRCCASAHSPLLHPLLTLRRRVQAFYADKDTGARARARAQGEVNVSSHNNDTSAET